MKNVIGISIQVNKGGMPPPSASSVLLTENAGVVSLGYTYSHPNSVVEKFTETQWEAINLGGSVVIGDTLTTTVLPSGTYTYQWYAADDNQGTNDAALAGATSSSLTLVDPTHLNKYIRVEATDANGDSYSSYYTGQVGYAAVLQQAFVPEGETTTVVLAFDRFMDLTSAGGWAIEVNGTPNAITAFDLFENTIRFTLTSVVAQHDLVTIAYTASSGNTKAFSNQLAIGDIPEKIVENFIGSTFGNQVRLNFTFYAADTVAGNWNNINVSPHGSADGSVANLIDETGANTGITFTVPQAGSVGAGEGNADNTAFTTNFPAPAYGDVWSIYDDNGDKTEKSTWQFTNLTPYQVYRIYTGIRGKGFGSINAQVYETDGFAKYSKDFRSSDNASTTYEEVSYMAMADKDGALTIVQRAGEQGKNADAGSQFDAQAPGIILDPVSDFDPRTLDFGALYMPMGAEKGGTWFDWAAGADGWQDNPSLGDPTWDATERAYSFDGTQGIRLGYNTSGISGSPYELWCKFKIPSTITNGETIFALSGSHVLKLITSGGTLRYNATTITTGLSTDTWYVARVYINGASGLVEVRDGANTVVQAETTFNFSTSGFSSPARLGSAFDDVTNPFHGKVAFVGIKPTAFDTTGKNNMFDWIYNKIK